MYAMENNAPKRTARDAVVDKRTNNKWNNRVGWGSFLPALPSNVSITLNLKSLLLRFKLNLKKSRETCLRSPPRSGAPALGDRPNASAGAAACFEKCYSHWPVRAWVGRDCVPVLIPILARYQIRSTAV